MNNSNEINEKIQDLINRGIIIDTEYPRSPQFKDASGMIINNLKVIKFVGMNKRRHAYYEVECHCGNHFICRISHINEGSIKSCGCYISKILHSSKRNIKHGLSRSPLYYCWQSMKARCYNPKNPEYHNYGGRGINICDEWLDKENGFMNFYNWSINNGFIENNKLSIDRINVDGNYEPSNCRWTYDKVQANNKRTSHYITYDRYKFTIDQWADICNLSRDVIVSRLRRGWAVENILFTPAGVKPGVKTKILAIPIEYLKLNKYMEVI